MGALSGRALGLLNTTKSKHIYRYYHRSIKKENRIWNRRQPNKPHKYISQRIKIRFKHFGKICIIDFELLIINNNKSM